MQLFLKRRNATIFIIILKGKTSAHSLYVSAVTYIQHGICIHNLKKKVFVNPLLKNKERPFNKCLFTTAYTIQLSQYIHQGTNTTIFASHYSIDITRQTHRSKHCKIDSVQHTSQHRHLEKDITIYTSLHTSEVRQETDIYTSLTLEVRQKERDIYTSLTSKDRQQEIYITQMLQRKPHVTFATHTKIIRDYNIKTS